MKKVQDFIDEKTVDQNEIEDNITKANMIRPSNVQSELMTLAMESATMNLPTIQDNPMASAAFETEKARIFDSILKDLNNEADEVRRAIDQHKKSMDAQGIKVPALEKNCGTQTFEDLYDAIIVNWKC